MNTGTKVGLAVGTLALIGILSSNKKEVTQVPPYQEPETPPVEVETPGGTTIVTPPSPGIELTLQDLNPIVLPNFSSSQNVFSSPGFTWTNTLNLGVGCGCRSGF